MKIVVLITTYNRPRMLQDLLQNIYLETKDSSHQISILVLDDNSTLDYSDVRKYLSWHFPHDYFKTERNYGKKDYWQLINFGYQQLSKMDFDYLVQVPDDITLVNGFFDKAIAAFDAIPDTGKACLNVLNDYARNGKSFWTGQQILDVSYAGHDMMRTGWVDMCYIASKNMLRALQYSINPVSHRWSGKKALSSGVGMQISQRLVKAGMNLYQVKKSLVIHDDHPSVMHPEHRQEVKLITNHRYDRITASMATMPGRERSLIEAVNSIIDQVDELHIYMNEIEAWPQFAGNPKVKIFFSKDHLGDLGDAGKFYTADDIEGYHFTIDDDIIYPSDYVNTMIAAIERYDRKAVISAHGRIFNKLPVKSYYHGHSKAFSCLHSVQDNVWAHIIGTGVLAYHTDTLKVDLSLFEYSNMADIWFSKRCNELRIPRVIIAHKKGWITMSRLYNVKGSIYTHQSINDKIQTDITNAVRWDACPLPL